MKSGEPSWTAIASAASRAAHLALHPGPKIHVDDYALRLVGLPGADALRQALEGAGMPALRRTAAYFALRHCFSEERLLAAVERGVGQVVLLGAGLDSLALRDPELAARVQLYEVDHPDTQRWKRERIADLGLAEPAVTYVPVDFEHQDLGNELSAASLDFEQPIFYSWLGVTQYIDKNASFETLALIAKSQNGSELVFDFVLADESLSEDEQPVNRAYADASERLGEPWISQFIPEELEVELFHLGFGTIERLTPEVAKERYYAGQPSEVSPMEAWQLIRATV